MGSKLADRIQSAFEGLGVAIIAACDKQLLKVRHCGASRLADVSGVRIGWQSAPADQGLSCRSDLISDDLFALFALICVGGEKDIADTVASGFWKCLGKGMLRHFPQQRVRQAGENASAVAAIFFVADAAAMLHTAIHSCSVCDDLVAGPAFYVANEAHPTTIFLVCWVV